MNNYEIQTENAKRLFLTYDQDRIIRKLQIASDDDYLYLPMAGLTYRVHRRTAMVEKRESKGGYREANSFNEALTLFDALCYSQEGCRLAGEWVSTSSLGGGVHSGSSRFFQDQADRMAPLADRLPRVLETMGGTPMPKGEPGYRLPAILFLPVYFQFWQADEEFPPQISLYWDANTTRVIHYETVYYLAGVLLERILALLEHN